MDSSSSKIILKFEYDTLKFKLAITEETKTFSQLLQKAVEKLNNMGQTLEVQYVDCADEQDFVYDNADEIRDFLQNNQLVKILLKPTSLNKSASMSSQLSGLSQIDNINQQGQTPQVVLVDSSFISQQSPQQQVDNQQQQPPQQPQQPQQIQQPQQPSNELKFVTVDSSNIASQQQQQQQQLQQQAPTVQDPTEAIVVLFDISGSMSTKFYGEEFLPRIGAVNAFFSAFADKTLAFELNHLLQLICFNNNIIKKCEFISDVNLFINLVDSANPAGGTRLYDALNEGVQNLLAIKKVYPNIILRMIALTDGEDNASVITPVNIAKLIIDNKIVLDSFVVGDNALGLKTVTHASGGRCYKPIEINQGLKLFEIETILSVSQRGEIVQVDSSTIDLNALNSKPFDTDGLQMVQPKSFNKAAENAHTIIQKYEQMQKQQQQQPSQPTGSSQGQPQQQQQPQQSAGQAVTKRIVKELQTIITKNDPLVKVYPTGDDISTWKVLLRGPKNSQYASGVYMLFVQFPQDYPFKPPKVRFMTPVYHCNVSPQGSLCLDILKDSWSPALQVSTVLSSIQSLLVAPNPDDALDSKIASEMIHEPDLYKQKCLQFTADKATHQIEELMNQIFGQDVKVGTADYEDKKKELTDWFKTSAQ